jgi:hypothetical protein
MPHFTDESALFIFGTTLATLSIFSRCNRATAVPFASRQNDSKDCVTFTQCHAETFVSSPCGDFISFFSLEVL